MQPAVSQHSFILFCVIYGLFLVDQGHHDVGQHEGFQFWGFVKFGKHLLIYGIINDIFVIIMINKESSPSYQQFHNKLKAKFKKQKQERKQNLRQIACRNLVQSSNGSNDEEYLKKSGNKWWGKINRHYFAKITNDILENMKQFTTSEDILSFGLPASMENFYREVICSLNDQIFFDDSIRILFRLYDKLEQKQKYILASYLCRNPSTNNLTYQIQLPQSINFYSFHPTLINPPKITSTEELNHFCEQNKKIDLELSGFTDNQSYIQTCLQYQTTWRNQSMTEVEREIECWENELEKQHSINMKNWDKIEDAWIREKQEYPEYVNVQQRIEELKKQLIHSQTFLYFRLGYADKTSQDFSAAVSYANEGSYHESKYVKKVEPVNNQFFETDCKICFCTKNEPSNKVIYCDSCSTSFHQSCYGIQFLDEEKELICDTCVLKKKSDPDKKNSQSPGCQICGRCKFPMKNINGHFYHVSCLILFDFADIHEFKINLKKGVNHETIMQAVVENEMDQDYCQFCIKSNYEGMKFKCSYPLCTKSFHPICAYLHGCIFEINRKSIGGIDVKIQCRDHEVSDFGQLAFQVYLRRYLCNYKHTARTKQEQFKQIYLKQLENLKKYAKSAWFQHGGIRRILNLKKFKDFSSAIDKKRPESLKKSQSVYSNASNSKSVIEDLKPPQKSQSNRQKSSHQFYPEAKR